MVFGPAVEVPVDASAAGWIAPALGRFGTVGGVVPPGYERHLVLHHPPDAGPVGVSGLFERLAAALAAHTTTPERCRFAVWDGYAFAPSTMDGLPAFDLPHRRYLLVHGPVTAASRLERPDTPFPQPPDLWWPEDRAWFVGGDVDLEWCYVGGTEDVTAAVAAAFPSAGPVSPDDPNATFGP